MNAHYNNNRQQSRLTSGLDKKGVLAKFQKALIPPHPVMEILLPPVFRVGTDGVDHINIDSYAQTQLGCNMNPRSLLRVDHPIYGPFNSVEGFWNWLLIEEKDDRLRTMKPFEMRQFMQRNNFQKLNPSDLRFRIMEASWIKIASHAQSSNEMRNSTLPFDCYRPSNDDLGDEKARSPMRVRPPFANWMIPAYEEIRTALKEGREPDLFGLLMTADDRESITTLASPEIRVKKPKEQREPKEKKPRAERAPQGEDIPRNLVDPRVVDHHKPFPIRGITTKVDTSSMADLDREHATAYGNPVYSGGASLYAAAPVNNAMAASSTEPSSLVDQFVKEGHDPAEVLNVTGIANPTDTMEEGGQQVQELVQEQLNAEGRQVLNVSLDENDPNPTATIGAAVASVVGDVGGENTEDPAAMKSNSADDETFALKA